MNELRAKLMTALVDRFGWVITPREDKPWDQK
jgi:hypothetical protein